VQKKRAVFFGRLLLQAVWSMLLYKKQSFPISFQYILLHKIKTVYIIGVDNSTAAVAASSKMEGKGSVTDASLSFKASEPAAGKLQSVHYLCPLLN
jgi:hypothetical protein